MQASGYLSKQELTKYPGRRQLSRQAGRWVSKNLHVDICVVIDIGSLLVNCLSRSWLSIQAEQEAAKQAGGSVKILHGLECRSSGAEETPPVHLSLEPGVLSIRLSCVQCTLVH